MYCSECGFQISETAKFCSKCGTSTSASTGSVVAPGAQSTSPTSIDVIIAGGSPEAESAKEAAVDRAEVHELSALAKRSVELANFEQADFWFCELVTSPNLEPIELVKPISDYINLVLVPLGRFAEAELYARELGAVNSEFATESRQLVDKVSEVRRAAGIERNQYSKRWRELDLSTPLSEGSTSQERYLRAIWLVDRNGSDEDFDPIVDPHHSSHMSYLVGYVIGFSESIRAHGVDAEAAIEGLTDWLDLQYADAKQHPDIIERRRSQRARQKQADISRQARIERAASKPTRNRLAEDLDKYFGQSELTEHMKLRFGVSEGLNDIPLLAVFEVSTKLGDSQDWKSTWLVFTPTALGLFKKGGAFSAAEESVIPLSRIASIGIGDSDHYEAQGFGGRSTQWESITINLTDGQRLTRHFYLGRSETEVNSRVPRFLQNLQALVEAGFPIEDGPAWSSSGGYRTSFGYGIWT